VTSVDREPPLRIGGYSLLRVALVCGLGFASPGLVGCGGGPKKNVESGASSAESPATVATAPLLGEATVALLPSAIQVKAEDPSSISVDSFVAALLVQALLEGRSGLTVEPRLDAEGASQGYRLGAIAEDSPFARLGLKEGDIVGAINGIGLTSPERARAAIASARRHAVVAVERGETALFLDYRLVDGLAWSSRVIEEGGEAVVVEPAVAVAVVDANALVAAVDDRELEALAADAKAEGHPGAGGEPSPTAAGTGEATDDSGAPTDGAGTSPAKSSGKSSGSKSKSKSGGKSSGSKSKSGGKSSGSKGKSGGGAGGGSSVSCASADNCTISRSELKAALANPAVASKQVRFTPHISGGKHRGYRLTSITPGSAVAGLGMRKGDVITKINGHSLTDQSDLIALYLGLSGTSTFRINYERGGAKRVKTVRAR